MDIFVKGHNLDAGNSNTFKFISAWTRSYFVQKKCLVVLFGCGIVFLILSSKWTFFFSSMRLEDGKPCKLHILDPWDQTLKEYLQKPPPIKCSRRISLMYVDEYGYLQQNNSAITSYNLKSLLCVYHVIRRVDGDKKIDIDVIGTPFQTPIFIKARIFRIICNNTDSLVYDFVHVNIMFNESISRENQIGMETDDQLSIVFLGIDSASRSHALRKIPKSYKFLTETLGAYDFQGYMKVGLNSFPNMFPLLSGENSVDHPLVTYLRRYLDYQPFLWKEKVVSQYSTLFSEDRPDISTFIFNKGGFKKSPVDYYYRPYSLALEEITPIILNPLGKSTWLCYGNKEHFRLQIDFFKSFMRKYNNRLKFGFLWNNQMGHESFLSLGHADEPLYDLLQWLKSNNHLERTILIVGSDHGFRMGGPSTTYIGRLENNMPFLNIYIPDILKSKYPWIQENLKYNTDKLLSAYDIYETMKDVIYKNYVQTKLAVQHGDINRRSLLYKLPEQRTCKDAGIPVQFCSCHDSKAVGASHPVVKILAFHVVNYLNQLLFKGTDLCEKLSLKNISEARKVKIANDANSYGFFQWSSAEGNSGRYELMIYTLPNIALIEVTMDYKAEKGDSGVITILGNPIRANRYGNQSHCVRNNTILKEYCFCSDQLKLPT